VDTGSLQELHFLAHSTTPSQLFWNFNFFLASKQTCKMESGEEVSLLFSGLIDFKKEFKK
jgi:hypothetical protein